MYVQYLNETKKMVSYNYKILLLINFQYENDEIQANEISDGKSSVFYARFFMADYTHSNSYL